VRLRHEAHYASDRYGICKPGINGIDSHLGIIPCGLLEATDVASIKPPAGKKAGIGMFVLPLALIFLAVCVATAAYVLEPSAEAKRQAVLQEAQQHVDQLRRTIAAEPKGLTHAQIDQAEESADAEIACEQLPYALQTLAAARAAVEGSEALRGRGQATRSLAAGVFPSHRKNLSFCCRDYNRI
jgi:cell division protein FtsB